MPTSHIPNSMYPMLDGVSLFTERAKSFIQSAFPTGLIPTASPMAVLVPEVGELFRLLSHERICGKDFTYSISVCRRSWWKHEADETENYQHCIL